jgi:hypothetical protein
MDMFFRSLEFEARNEPGAELDFDGGFIGDDMAWSWPRRYSIGQS